MNQRHRESYGMVTLAQYGTAMPMNDMDGTRMVDRSVIHFGIFV